MCLLAAAAADAANGERLAHNGAPMPRHRWQRAVRDASSGAAKLSRGGRARNPGELRANLCISRRDARSDTGPLEIDDLIAYIVSLH
jgi:hypothetical protein